MGYCKWRPGRMLIERQQDMEILGVDLSPSVSMMFVVVVVNTKVVANFIIYLVLNFHDHRLDNLGALDFTSSLLDFACSLYRSE